MRKVESNFNCFGPPKRKDKRFSKKFVPIPRRNVHRIFDNRISLVLCIARNEECRRFRLSKETTMLDNFRFKPHIIVI